MEREDIIKILVKNMNDLKGDNNQYKILLEGFEDIDDELKKYKHNTKIYILLICIQFLILIDCIKNNYDCLIPCASLICILLNFTSSTEKYRISGNVKYDINCIKENLSTNSEKIENLQIAIEFLQSLTEEEAQKYLKFKM